MTTNKPTYGELETRLAVAEPIVEALRHHEVDAVVGEQKIAFLLLQEVGLALLNSEASFRAMFDLSGVGMAQADTPSLRFTRVNHKFCEIMGYSPEDLLTKTAMGITYPHDHLRTMKALSQVLRGKADSWSIENRCIRKDGSVIWVCVHGAAIRDQAGRVIKVLAMITDITAHKQAELQLRVRSMELRKLARELNLAEQRERRRIARVLHDHIEHLLVGVKRRAVPLKRAEVKTVREALQDVQDFIDQSIAPPPPPPPPAHQNQRKKGKG